MRSETAVRKRLETLKEDLEWWKRKQNLPGQLDVKSSLERTISGIEGAIDSLEWILKGE